MPCVTVIQPVTFDVERLDVASPVGDQEDLAFLENGALEDRAGLDGRHQLSAVSSRCRARVGGDGGTGQQNHDEGSHVCLSRGGG